MENKSLDVSFLIVALGDYRKQVNKIIKQKLDFSYEILVCSDNLLNFDIPNFKFFKDQGTSVSSFNHLYRNSKGKFIVCLSGVVLPPDNINSLIKKMNLRLEKGEDFIITSFSDSYGAVAYVPEWVPRKTNLEHRSKIIRWPCLYRETVEKYLDGVIFNESFVHHYVDNWLGTFCDVIGKSVEEDREFRITDIPHSSLTKSDDYDKNVYELLCDSARKELSYNLSVKPGE